jgi:hypothetical protein
MCGMGKTWLVKKLLNGKPRLLVFDTMEEYNNRSWNQITGLAHFCRHWQSRPKANYQVSFRPVCLSPDFDAINKWVYDVGRLCYVIEELSFFTSANYLPDSLSALVRCRRHREIDLIATAQRAADVSKQMIGLTSMAFIFKTTEPNSLDYLARWIPGNLVSALPGLGVGEFVCYDFLKAAGSIQRKDLTNYSFCL